MEIPDKMKHLKLFRGLPIPYTVVIKPNGDPDFRITDTAKWKTVILKKLCGICGRKLGLKMCFIGGPKCAALRIFFDPPMHKECAYYSAEVCPFIASPNKGYSDKPVDLPSSTKVVTDELASAMKTEMFIFETSGYRLIEVEKSIYFKANKYLSIKKVGENG